MPFFIVVFCFFNSSFSWLKLLIVSFKEEICYLDVTFYSCRAKYSSFDNNWNLILSFVNDKFDSLQEALNLFSFFVTAVYSFLFIIL